MQTKSLLVCSGCGRCGVALLPSERRINGGICREAVVREPVNSALVTYGVLEVGVYSGEYCLLCLQWYSLDRGKTFRRNWNVAWPSYVARALRGECAQAVMQIMPVELRRQWRLLRCKVPGENIVEETVKLVGMEEMTMPNPMILEDFKRLAEKPFDSKCAICRGCFSAYEMVPFSTCKFPELHWNSGEVKRGTVNPQGVDAMLVGLKKPRMAPNFTKPWLSPLGFKVCGRVGVDKEHGLFVAVCVKCRSNPHTNRFFGPSLPSELLFSQCKNETAIFAAHWRSGEKQIGMLHVCVTCNFSVR